MPLYEFVLRVEGRSEETLLGDRNGVCRGDEIEIRNVRWTVVEIEEAPTPLVAARIMLARSGDPRAD